MVRFEAGLKELTGGLARRPDRFGPGEPGGAQRALARDFPPAGRELSGDRRAGRLAQPCAHPADSAVAGIGAQRDVGPGAPRPHLRAAYLGRPAADRAGPALLRRRADGDRRPHRGRPPLDRGTGRRCRPQPVAGIGPHRSLADALGPDALGLDRAHHQEQRAAQAHRVRAAGAGARARRAGGRGRAGRKPHPQYSRRTAEQRAGGSRQLPERAHQRQDLGRAARRHGNRRAGKPGRDRSAHAEDHSPRGWRAGRAARARSAS